MKQCCKQANGDKAPSIFRKAWNVLVAAILMAILAGIVAQLFL